MIISTLFVNMITCIIVATIAVDAISTSSIVDVSKQLCLLGIDAYAASAQVCGQYEVSHKTEPGH